MVARTRGERRTSACLLPPSGPRGMNEEDLSCCACVIPSFPPLVAAMFSMYRTADKLPSNLIFCLK